MEIFDWLKTGKLQEMEGRIWQCRAGHLLCEPCKDRPEVRDKLLNWKLKGRNRKCRLTWNNLISAAMQIWPSKISFILGTRRWQPVQRDLPQHSHHSHHSHHHAQHNHHHHLCHHHPQHPHHHYHLHWHHHCWHSQVTACPTCRAPLMGR